ncbi:Spt20 family-domain-containing protein [Myxozyma melibiosi]|uniref:Spt20 family-domain-containing protein n=1 Tax=Myxozyma melibiosi TaxID=54550 RepID=A0ABR1F977_9ASCO
MTSKASKTRPPGFTAARPSSSSSSAKTKAGATTNGIATNRSSIGSSNNSSSSYYGNSPATPSTPASSSGATSNIKKVKLIQKSAGGGVSGASGIAAVSASGSPTTPTGVSRKASWTSAANAKSHLVNSMTPASLSADGKAGMLDDDSMMRVSGRRPKLDEYKFAETSEEILEKYKGFPSSIDLHIYPTHYRFGNQDAVIPASSPSIKSFMDQVKLGQIPPPAVEIFHEAGVKFYEGCIILEVYDHRANSSGFTGEHTSQEFNNPSSSLPLVSSTSSKPSPQQKQQPTNTAVVDQKPGDQQSSATSSSANQQSSGEPHRERILLHPTPLSLWYDLTWLAERTGACYSDALTLTLESQILATTVPRLDLAVPTEPPFSQPDLPPSLQPTPPPSLAVKDDLGLLHAPNPPTMAKRKRPLHEDLPQQSTEYEEMMLIMDERPPTGTGQFVRLGFVEQWRRKRERERQQKLAASVIASNNAQMGGNGASVVSANGIAHNGMGAGMQHRR